MLLKYISSTDIFLGLGYLENCKYNEILKHFSLFWLGALLTTCLTTEGTDLQEKTKEKKLI